MNNILGDIYYAIVHLKRDNIVRNPSKVYLGYNQISDLKEYLKTTNLYPIKENGHRSQIEGLYIYQVDAVSHLEVT